MLQYWVFCKSNLSQNVVKMLTHVCVCHKVYIYNLTW